MRVAHFELRRLLWPPPDYDIDPNDPHNVLWPKLLELALTLPFVLGFRTKDVARLLAATLCLEAASVWQFWWVAPLEARLLELNLERDALSMEYDRLLPQGSKTMANRRRVAELEARLGAVNRECSDLRLELKHAAAASTAEIGGTA